VNKKIDKKSIAWCGFSRLPSERIIEEGSLNEIQCKYDVVAVDYDDDVLLYESR
jgi:hypothetical protein